MEPLALQASLVAQAYEAILGEISDGRLPANTRLVQALLAERLGVSRQPVQQALFLLKKDGVVQSAGKRGLIVAPLDLTLIQQHYRVRGALDALAASLAAERCGASAEVAAEVERQASPIVAAGQAAVATGSITAMVEQDAAFHAMIYEASGNPLIAPTAACHWRYLRRVMAEVLRHAEPPPAIWQQHQAILGAILRGDPIASDEFARQHAEVAAASLARSVAADDAEQGGSDEPPRKRA